MQSATMENVSTLSLLSKRMFLFFQARHAAQIGASGIAVIAPSFYKPSAAGRNDGKAQLEQKQPSSCYSHTLHFPNRRFPHFLAFPDVLRTFLKEIAAVAPTLPFYYYHLPAVTGVNSRSQNFTSILQPC